ncbi:Uncharacterized protein CTRI78_v005652 [Colletotrichum trifolii]|uniref:DUF2235 domain-containing protein n=1 Tax=Colletotrichum trifolii TaxID=5466 RepID=A0A4R8RE93_COLTR|nr:Uncharacterized protein CTRI78_v005652 [Colletotrichum trifolii]
MSAAAPLRRIIVCVDGTWYNADGKEGNGKGNNSNVFRIFASVRPGLVTDGKGKQAEQIVKYFPGIGVDRRPLNKFNDGITGDGCTQQIEDVYRASDNEYCSAQVKSSKDEVWLYGFSRGAYVVRAVATLLHAHTLNSKVASSSSDKSVWKRVTRLGPRKNSSDKYSTGGEKYRFALENTQESPVVKFLGLFDTVKKFSDNDEFDISHVSSIQHVRHAMALNEDQQPMSVVSYDSRVDGTPVQEGKRFLQAWFVGAHADMGGGARDDGLSLYPLQWMLTESENEGLITSFDPPPQAQNLIHSPLDLAFPKLPPLIGSTDSDRSAKSQPWTYRYSNGLEVTMYDLRLSHDSGSFQEAERNRSRKQTRALTGSHIPRLNRGFFSNWSLGRRAVFEVNDYGKLLGYNADTHDGTIIHPSVYFLLDNYPEIAKSKALDFLKGHLDFYRAHYMIPILNGGEAKSDHWIQEVLPEHSSCRILICGNTGVGKSTLLNKVFGIPMTQESSDERGQHNIEDGFESDQHPGIIIHDSEGFQAGNDKELAIFKNFLEKRSGSATVKERLHAIWLCIDTDTDRPVQSALANVLKEVINTAPDVPLIIVGTKKDKFVKFRQLDDDYAEELEKKRHMSAKELELDLLSSREELFKKKFASDPETSVIWPQLDAKFTFVSRNDVDSIKSLVHTTTGSLTEAVVTEAMWAAQVTNIDAKIDQAVEKTLQLLRTAVNTASFGAGFGLTSVVYTTTISHRLCHEIAHGCFGMPEAKVAEIDSILGSLVWANFSAFMKQSLGQAGAIWGSFVALSLTTLVGGIPLALGAPLFEAPAAARMVIKCACDLILVLDQAFLEGGKTVSQEKIRSVATMYMKSKITAAEDRSAANQSRRKIVHEKINELIPLPSTIGKQAIKKRSTDLAKEAYRRKSPSEYRDVIRSILAKYRLRQTAAEVDNTDTASVGSATLYSESMYPDIPEDQEEMKLFKGDVDVQEVGDGVSRVAI